MFRKPSENFNKKNHWTVIFKELYNFYCLINIYTPTRQSTISKHSKQIVYLIHPNHSFHSLIKNEQVPSTNQVHEVPLTEFSFYEQIPSEKKTSDDINVKKSLVTTSTAYIQQIFM